MNGNMSLINIRVKLNFSHGKLNTNFGNFNFFSEGDHEVQSFTDQQNS